MGSASSYWRLVRIDAAGQRKVEEIAIAKTFFHQQFPEFLAQADVADSTIQSVLIKRLRTTAVVTSNQDRQPAEWCLRCYISHGIEQACRQLEAQFGEYGGFTRSDLFPFVLDDDGRVTSRATSSYRSLAEQILQSFEPERASLNTWIGRQVRQHPELRAFLLQHGIYLISDWAILNDTRPEQAARILSEFYNCSAAEVGQAEQLMQSYHTIYRHDRLKLRQAGILKGRTECTPPNPDQLTRMAHALRAQAALNLSSEQIMQRLQTLAKQLRQYRVAVRTGNLPTESLDQPQIAALATEMQAADSDLDCEAQTEFLSSYRQQFLSCLDGSFAQATADRVAYLKRKDPQTAQQFLLALHLFHCQGQSMGEIAHKIGLRAQFQVSRLLKLKEFRAHVRQQLLQQLTDRVVEQAQIYTQPTQLHQLNQKIAAALDEQITSLMQQADAEAAVAKNHPLASVFARRLCHYLDVRGLYHV